MNKIINQDGYMRMPPSHRACHLTGAKEEAKEHPQPRPRPDHLSMGNSGPTGLAFRTILTIEVISTTSFKYIPPVYRNVAPKEASEANLDEICRPPGASQQYNLTRPSEGWKSRPKPKGF